MSATGAGTGALRLAPVTATQRQLYALVSRFAEISRTYHVCEAHRIRGRLDTGAFTTAVDDVVARHETLRTAVVRTNAGLRQAIEPAAHGTMRTVDLADVPADDREQTLAAAVRAECDTAFRFARDRLARFTLYRLSAHDHVILMVVHHLVIDGYSQSMVWRELEALYAAAVEGAPSDLPPVRAQFADYAARQEEWLTGRQARGMVDYWLGELAGCPDGPTVPYDEDTSAVLSNVGRRQHIVVSDDLTARVIALARERGITPAAVMLFAWQVLIGRLAKVRTVVTGVPMANRMRVEFLDAMGCFVNTHAVRVELSPGRTVGELLQDCAAKLMGAVVNQELSLPTVAAAAKEGRAPPLPTTPYRVMFNYQDRANAPLHLTGLTVDQVPLAERTRKADLTLHAGRREGEQLMCEFEYGTRLYRDETIAALMDSYVDILRRVVSSPHHSADALLGEAADPKETDGFP